jgi:hypothetical protein
MRMATRQRTAQGVIVAVGTAAAVACGTSSTMTPSADGSTNGDANVGDVGVETALGVEASNIDSMLGDSATTDSVQEGDRSGDMDGPEDAGNAGTCAIPLFVHLSSAPGGPPESSVGSVVIEPDGELCLPQAGFGYDGGTAMLQFGWSPGTNVGAFVIVSGSSGWRLVSDPDASMSISDATDVTLGLVDSSGDSLRVSFRFQGGAVLVEQVSFGRSDAAADASAGD